jgi:hypothetical protein
MQYLISVIHDSTDMGTGEELSNVDAFNGRLGASGNGVFARGLGAPSTATVIDNRGAQPAVTEGPFLKSKEYVSGLWIVEAADRNAAMSVATEASKHSNRKVEVRPFH